MAVDKIRVLVVDDSAFMRKALTMMLEEDPQIKVVGSARDGQEGCEKVKSLKPDLVTMDIEMPRMDGLTALKNIMDENPTPVMMLSSLTTEGAGATLDAMDLGAVDFIPKELSYVSLDIVKIKEGLQKKIKDIARRKHILMARYKQAAAFKKAKGTKQHLRTKIRTGGARFAGKPGVTKAAVSSPRFIKKQNHHIDIIAIGSSTGGPPALQEVITKLPKNLPVGVVVAQHMPPMFTKSLAERLDKLSQVTVKEAENGEIVQPGFVYIAPGGKHLTLKKFVARAKIVISDKPDTTLYKPCVDVMIKSVAEIYGKSVLGVILTGMGSNGVIGLKLVNNSGGKIIAQNAESCIVYGMPKAVVDAQIADHIASIENIYSEIAAYF